MNNWISIEDKDPTYDTWVFVSTKNKLVFMGFYFGSWKSFKDFSGSYINPYFSDDRRITHWMPFEYPEPPEEIDEQIQRQEI